MTLDLALAHRRLRVKNSKSLSRRSGKRLMKVFPLQKQRPALKKRLTNNSGEQVTLDLVLAHHRLLVKNNKL